MQTGVRVIGVVVFVAGLVVLLLAPLLGSAVFDRLWSVEPLSYIGAVVLLIGLGVTSLSFFVPIAIAKYRGVDANGDPIAERWAQITQQYFDLFDHDLGRPMRRISGKERELRAILQALEKPVDPSVEALLDEIEIQTPNFRLMMSNIQVLVQLESPNGSIRRQPVEPSEVVRKIVDRYTTVAEQANKEITWWCEPSEFGLVYSDGSAIEHIVTNLVDNAVRFATSHIEVKLTRNPRMFFVRVWDDGPGIAPQYVRHVFDHGWTPEMARREEKSSSGLGLFIVQTLAKRWRGAITLESVFGSDPDHHTAFLLELPLGEN